MKISPTLQARFDANTRRQGGCLVWSGSVTNAGYGVISIASGKVKSAHHAAFFLRYGRWAERLRHTCDNPLCCEAGHLIEGTQKQNMADKVERNRQAQGERHGMCKLTDDQVRAIRALRSTTTLKSLAREFGTSISNVSYICRGETRKSA